LNDTAWKTRRFRAHNPDFSEILWPEKFSKERLLAIRQSYANQGNLEGYSQEYLNYPLDESTAYFRRDDIVPMDDVDYITSKKYYGAVDLAISLQDKANWTAIAVGGVDSQNLLHIVEIRRGRWDSLEIIEQLFDMQQKYQFELFLMEAGAIEKAIMPLLNSEMLRKGAYINIFSQTPIKDKPTRARGIQARVRAKGVRFNKEGDWYPDFEEEFLRFPKAKTDDMVDSLAWLGLILDQLTTANTPQEDEEEEYLYMARKYLTKGRNVRTGY
jgi:predicted phage terminase large subunit-like protein